MNTVIFQQDGAPPHSSNAFLLCIKEHFPNGRLISPRTDNLWPPYLSDISPPDFFLWGYLKGKVYTNKPRTIQKLKEGIIREVRDIPQEMIFNIIDNFKIRVAAVRKQCGAWIEYLLK